MGMYALQRERDIYIYIRMCIYISIYVYKDFIYMSIKAGRESKRSLEHFWSQYLDSWGQISTPRRRLQCTGIVSPTKMATSRALFAFRGILEESDVVLN